jgi:flagellar biosynthesis/type III secretory pathway M-ring protein FliF/YscJ
MSHWESIKSFFKKYWGVLVGAVVLLFGAGVFYERKRVSSKEGQKSTLDEGKVIDQIEEISSEVQQGLEENEKKHDDIVKSVEDQYQQQSKNLDEDKKKEVKKLAQDYAENPEELAKKLSELTGFKVVLPEE